MSKPNVIRRVLAALESGGRVAAEIVTPSWYFNGLFKVRRPDKGVVVKYDHTDRRGPNSHLSEEARKAGVTCPDEEGDRGRRLF
jgi:hypothetical protein